MHDFATILVTYSEDPIIAAKKISKLLNNKSILITVINNPGYDIKSKCCFNRYFFLKGDNKFREFGAYLHGIKFAKESSLKFNNYVLVNDTVLKNKSIWKFKYIKAAFNDHIFKAPVLYGLIDRSFHILSSRKYLNPNIHVRTDLFALNSYGAELLLHKYENIDLQIAYNEINSDSILGSVIDEFISFYHSKKLGQDKEFATLIELQITDLFLQCGLVYPVLTSKFGVFIRYFWLLIFKFTPFK